MSIKFIDLIMLIILIFKVFNIHTPLDCPWWFLNTAIFIRILIDGVYFFKDNGGEK